MAAMGVAAGAAAAVGLTRASRDAAGRLETAVPLANPFGLAVAVKFAALLTLFSLVVKVAQQESEGRGVLAVAASAGLTDADAIPLSMATDARDGGRLATAAAAVAIAAVSNTLVKCALVAWLGFEFSAMYKAEKRTTETGLPLWPGAAPARPAVSIQAEAGAKARPPMMVIPIVVLFVCIFGILIPHGFPTERIPGAVLGFVLCLLRWLWRS